MTGVEARGPRRGNKDDINTAPPPPAALQESVRVQEPGLSPLAKISSWACYTLLSRELWA